LCNKNSCADVQIGITIRIQALRDVFIQKQYTFPLPVCHRTAVHSVFFALTCKQKYICYCRTCETTWQFQNAVGVGPAVPADSVGLCSSDLTDALRELANRALLYPMQRRMLHCSRPRQVRALSFVFRCLRNIEKKWPLASSCPPACLPLHLSICVKKTRLPLDGFSWNLVFDGSSKICQEKVWLKSDKKERALYMKADVHLW